MTTSDKKDSAKCINCGDRRYVGGRQTLPNGSTSTKTPCYLCNKDK